MRAVALEAGGVPVGRRLAAAGRPAPGRSPRRAAGRTPPVRRRHRDARARCRRRSRCAAGRPTECLGRQPVPGRARCRGSTIALAPSGGSGASQPCWAASTRSAGTSASAAPPLPWPSSTRDRRAPSSGHQVGQASARSRPPDRPPRRPGRQCRARRCRSPVTSGRPQARRASRHAAAGLLQRGRARAGGSADLPAAGPGPGRPRADRRSGPGPAAVLGSLSPCAGAADGSTPVGGAFAQQPAHPGPVRPPGGAPPSPRPARPRRQVSSASAGSRTGGTAAVRVGDARSSARSRRSGAASSSGDDGVDQRRARSRFSAVCTPGRERLARRAASYDPGAEEPDQRPRARATVTCPSEPHEANTPPVVGCRR